MGDYWQDNGIEKPQQIVVCAALQNHAGEIVCGARHYDKIMQIGIKARTTLFTNSFRAENTTQGFINQFGEFLTRREAMAAVKASGQPFDIKRNQGDVFLTSEGLY